MRENLRRLGVPELRETPVDLTLQRLAHPASFLALLLPPQVILQDALCLGFVASLFGLPGQGVQPVPLPTFVTEAIRVCHQAPAKPPPQRSPSESAITSVTPKSTPWGCPVACLGFTFTVLWISL